jgi:CMP/dCMP kinase
MHADRTEPPHPPTHDKVSIAGHVGSGKSSVARLVAERTGRRFLSTGHMFRDIASRHGMTVLELNRHAETHPEIDDEVDGHLRELAMSDEALVIDSRMAWHFVPASFKAYLVVDPIVGAERVLGASRRDESYGSLEEAARANLDRQRVEADRYRALYGVVRDHWGNYDLVVDTTDISADRVADIVVEALGGTIDGLPLAPGPDCRLAPHRLVPTDPAADTPRDDDRVGIVVCSGSHFIVSGHHLVTAALGEGLPLVPCHLVAYEPAADDPISSSAGTLRSMTDPAAIAGWQADHRLRFTDLPAWVGEEDEDQAS